MKILIKALKDGLRATPVFPPIPEYNEWCERHAGQVFVCKLVKSKEEGGTFWPGEPFWIWYAENTGFVPKSGRWWQDHERDGYTCFIRKCCKEIGSENPFERMVIDATTDLP